MRVAIIWLPMVPGDDHAAARANSNAYHDARVWHAWDPTRFVGRTWTATFVARHADVLASAARGIPGLAERFTQLSPDVDRAPATWDAAFFFASGVEWRDPLPEPDVWTKQFYFELDATTGESHGEFWSDREPRTLVASSWRAEFALGMARITSR